MAEKKYFYDILQVTKETMSERYLGLPIHVSQPKSVERRTI